MSGTRAAAGETRMQRLGNPLVFLLDIALMFLYLNNISFVGAPSASTGRFVLAGLVFLHSREIWRELSTLGRANGAWVFLFGLIALHVTLISVLSPNADQVQLSRLLNFAVFVVVGGVVFMVHMRRDSRRFAYVVALATLVQSVMVFISYVSPAYRVWLTTIVVQGGNIPLTSSIQAPGFSNSSGAALSVLQMVGVFAALYASRLEPRVGRSLVLVLIACANMASTFLVGRTGLMMSIVAIGGFLLSGIGQRGLLRLAGGLVVSAIALFIWGDDLLAYLDRVNPQLGETVARSVSVLRSATADPSVVDLATQPIPPLSISTVIGTGRVLDVYGSASGNDSGYIQTYFAAGLIATILFYSGWVAFVLKQILRAQQRDLLALFAIIMMLIELKEPFVFKYGLPFVLLGLALCEGVSRQRAQESSHASPAAAP